MNRDRDMENMHQTLTSSEVRNWNFPRDIIDVIQIKDIQSSIPLHPKVVFCDENYLSNLCQTSGVSLDGYHTSHTTGVNILFQESILFTQGGGGGGQGDYIKARII